MKLSISNIAWDSVNDNKIYNCMKAFSFTGLEIAPTRIFPDAPYDCLKEAKQWKENLLEEYGFHIPSMQSIWFGRQENIFGTQRERDLLTMYTNKAIDFAAEIDCGNFCAISEKIESKTDAEKLKQKCLGKTAIVQSVEQKQKTEKPPKLYDLTTLQRKANKIYGYTAQQTLEY